ncbi:bifunctional diaminohydroxyphosphoribosylaminopyrimidine deaminase/5-amino-6-(5-phosphoribosylamino)uracil reductase RibD [Candidatus Sumerlaeota bacterium]|nr:bifunctional diaminohydroxyphosphoribosylaminopyrimidine deaminase/5-amino-6-(5-phosphoribosylamino)uracil reductase RibD [Candidatus Sumerlaeota bacterium]MBI3735557.1 bifunctional diaminohydroxyphosphoribosylaminopyrimidine deaminase/5-amino-6-(5-phosphoribosylamino)uracil reductase RibD [Candidatus Sumerlaeota bacterium]
MTKADETFMRNALALAEKARGRTSPNPMVGAVIVKDGRIVGHGFHAKAGDPHAEVIALTEAGEHAAGAALYCNLEPCCHFGRTPPCTKAVIEAGIVRVVAGMVDPNKKVAGKGIAELRAAGIEVEIGCLEREARRLNEFFVAFHTLGRPFVTIKWAMTLDGRTGSDTNHSRWISNEASRRYVHQLRAQHDAILIGIGTILADDPMLNVRLENYDGRQPIRVVIDGDLSIPRRAKMLRERNAGPVILVTTPYAPEETRKALEADGHRVVVLPGKRRLIDVGQLMEFLAGEKILSVLAEGGRQIHTSLLSHQLADKIVAFISPKIIGGSELRSPVEALGLSKMDQALQILHPRWLGFDEDICLEGYLREV